MTLNFSGKLMDVSHPLVMGIINLNSDSFFSGSRAIDEKSLLTKLECHLEEGADIIDLGFMSSRPGAQISQAEEEADMMENAVAACLSRFPEAILSIDTLHALVAKRTLEAGALMINDISAGSHDETMFSTVAPFKVPICLMHMQGLPQNMQNKPEYQNVVLEVAFYLQARKNLALQSGILDIVVDPGFGFGKSLNQNYELLNKLSFFKQTEAPILVGISRKSMIYNALSTDAQHALNGTTALNMLALEQGANILRVHDVRQAKECITLFKLYKQGINETLSF